MVSWILLLCQIYSGLSSLIISFYHLAWPSLDYSAAYICFNDILLFQVGPHEIYVVGREDDGASLDDGTASDGASWETFDDNEMDVLDDSAKVFSTAVWHNH